MLAKHGGITVDEKKRYQSAEFAAFLSALLTGMVAHAFALVNILHNYDNILQQPKGFGAGVTSGRWMLTLMGDFCQNVLDLGYNMPLTNGLAFLLLIALSAAFLTNILELRRRGSAVLAGCVMATFPTVCATMVFRYTAPYYGASLLLSVLAVWVASRKRWGLLLSALCIACSMGIYQAYVPFSISLFVLVLMKNAMREDAQLSSLIRQGLTFCACLLLGLLLYFGFLKLTLAAYDAQLDTYQGINSMGKISLAQLPGLIRDAWLSAALFSVKDYCTLASTPVLKILWTLLILVILVLALLLVVLRKPKPQNAAFFCLMGLVFPLAVNFIVVMAPEGIVYTIMVYSFSLIGIAPLMLLENLPDFEKKRLLAGVLSGLLVLIVWYNGYYTNLNYTSLFYANRHVENYFSGLMTQMRMTEGYTPDKTWAFLGDQVDDPKLYDIWNVEPVYGGFIGSTAKGLLNASYSVDVWIHSFIGYETVYASGEEEAVLAADPRVTEMPCWPSQGSIRVVDDYIVVKFQELAN